MKCSGSQREQPDNRSSRPDSWEVARRQEKVELKVNITFQIRGGRLNAITGRPSILLDLPAHLNNIARGAGEIMNNALNCSRGAA
jgi:hypothetical protein